MNLLVTGAAGFIGSNFVRYWQTHHPEDFLLLVDVLSYAGNRRNLEGLTGPDCVLVEADINNTALMANLLTQYKLSTIVNFAAESHVDRSIESPDDFIESNILGTHSLLKAARKIWQSALLPVNEHRFHQVSTDEVYGTLQFDSAPFTEQSAYAPNSPYSASKASADFLVRSYHQTYQLNVSTSICSNNYGPYQLTEKLIPKSITNMLLGLPVPVYGDGQNVRDWLHVDDHVCAIDGILRKGVSGRSYNIGSAEEWTNLDLLMTIAAYLDKQFKRHKELGERFPDCPASKSEHCSSLITHVADRPGHDLRYAMQPSCFLEKNGFAATTSFDSGIKSTIDWYIDNRTWWEP